MPANRRAGSDRSLAQRVEYALGLARRNLGGEFLDGQLAQSGNTSKSPQQFLCSPVAHAGNFRERSANAAGRPTLPVKSDRETVGLIADLLDQMENGRVMIEHNRFMLASEHIENFFFLRDARDR